MALEPQTLQFPLFKGVNTKVDPKQIPLGDMYLLENAVFTTVQEYNKRNGYSALAVDVITSPFTFTFQKLASTISNGSFISTFKDEIVMGDGYGFYSYSDADNKWAYKGRLESARVGVTPIYQKTNEAIPSSINVIRNQANPDSAVNTTTNYTLYAWEIYGAPQIFPDDPYGFHYSLIDNETGQTIVSDILTTVGVVSRPRCVSIGSLLYVIYVDESNGLVVARPVTNTGIGSATTLVSDIDNTSRTTCNYDVLVNNSLIYLAYNGTGSTVQIESFNSALVSQASVSKSEVASNGIGIFADSSNNIWCAFNDATDTQAFIMDSTLVTTVLAPTVVEAAVTNVQNVTGCYDGTSGVILYDQPGEYAVQNPTGVSTTADFTQPAVGATVVANIGSSVEEYVGQVVFVAGGGYYYITTATATSVTLYNLGSASNVAPTTNVTFPRTISPTNGARSNALIRFNTLTAAGSAGTAAVFTRALGLYSRAFVRNNVAHVIAGYESNTQPTLFLCSLFNVNASLTNTPQAHIVARIQSNSAGGLPNKSVLSSVNNYATDQYEAAFTNRTINIVKTIANTSFSNFFTGISSVDLNLAPTQVSKQEIGNNLHVASGTLMMYDGTSVVEHGFHMFPSELTAVDSGTGRIADGSYSYVAVYAWTDGQGQIHRSAPSSILNITAGGGTSAIVVTIPNLRVTEKNDSVIELYRTAASGTLFYRVDSNAMGTALFPLRNLTTANTTTFTDVYGDDEIIGNQQLYTTGEIENIVSPAPITLSTFKNRLIVVPADDRTEDWYSKQVIPGSPVELNDSFILNTDQASGPIIGTVQLDDKGIIFKGKNIYYVVGSGPAPSGANNDFSDPILIATDVGLVDPASIIVMPHGVMFKSNKGVYLLDRSFQVQYIGAQVESYNQYTILSAQLIASVNQVRFMLSSGQAIVYDYFINQWVVFTNHPAIDTIISGTSFYYLRSTGVVLMETPGVYSDNGSFISMKMVTGWLQFGSVQGFQRFWKTLLLGKYYTAHSLSVSFAYDFSSSTSQTVTILPTAPVPYEWQVAPARQKCSSVQITIQDVYTDTIGRSYSLSNLAFEVGIKRGLNKLGTTQRYG